MASPKMPKQGKGAVGNVGGGRNPKQAVVKGKGGRTGRYSSGKR